MIELPVTIILKSWDSRDSLVAAVNDDHSEQNTLESPTSPDSALNRGISFCQNTNQLIIDGYFDFC